MSRKDYIDTATLIADEILVPLSIIPPKRWRIWGQNMEIPMDNKPYLVADVISAKPYGINPGTGIGNGDENHEIHTNIQETLQFTLFADYDACEDFMHRFFAALNTDVADNCQMKNQFRLANVPSSMQMGTIKIGSTMRHRADLRVQTLRTRTTTFPRRLMKIPDMDQVLFEP